MKAPARNERVVIALEKKNLLGKGRHDDFDLYLRGEINVRKRILYTIIFLIKIKAHVRNDRGVLRPPKKYESQWW